MRCILPNHSHVHAIGQVLQVGPLADLQQLVPASRDRGLGTRHETHVPSFQISKRYSLRARMAVHAAGTRLVPRMIFHLEYLICTTSSLVSLDELIATFPVL